MIGSGLGLGSILQCQPAKNSTPFFLNLNPFLWSKATLLFALRWAIPSTQHYQLICTVCRIQPRLDSSPSRGLQDWYNHWEQLMCPGFSSWCKNRRKHELSDKQREGRREGAGWGYWRRVTGDGTSPERPQPVSPGPGSAEACQHQQKINKLWVWECLECWGEGTRHSGWGTSEHSHRELVWSCNDLILVKFIQYFNRSLIFIWEHSW